MSVKLLNFDTLKDNMPTSMQDIDMESVEKEADETEEILESFLIEIEQFAASAIESSSEKQIQFLHGVRDITDGNPAIMDNVIEFSEAENRSEIEDFHLHPLPDLSLENSNIAASSSVEDSIHEDPIHMEQVHVEQDYRDSVISTLNIRLSEYVKILEQQNGETLSIRESLEKLKGINSDLESDKRVLSAEIQIGKKELEFTEKRLLGEITGLNEKIADLQARLGTSAKEAEVMMRERMNAEVLQLQASKSLEEAEDKHLSLKDDIKSREAEIKSLQEKFYENSVLQEKRIHELEGKLYQNDAKRSQTIKELEHKIAALEAELKLSIEVAQNDNEVLKATENEKLRLKELVEQIESVNSELERRNNILAAELRSERNALEEIRERAQMESAAFQNEIQELSAKLIETQKQKEQFIANKLNSTLQVKRESYIEKNPGRLSKVLFAVFAMILIGGLGYTLYNRHHSTAVQKELTNQMSELNSEFENRLTHIEEMNLDQEEMKVKLEELGKQINLFRDEVGKDISELETKQSSIIEMSEKRDVAAAGSDASGESGAILENSPVAVGGGGTGREVAASYPEKLSESIFFNSSSISVEQDEIEKIKDIAALCSANPGTYVKLEGHTDDRSFRMPVFQQFANNLELSIARAAEVSRLLVQYGLDTRRISITGFGDVEPSLPNDNPENRKRNRRVDIKISDRKVN